MRIVINDSSALIDLAKVRLIESLLRLPYEFVIPDVIYTDELLRLKHYRREELLDLGFVIGALDGPRAKMAFDYSRRYSAPSLNDCFALVHAETHDNAILLTGDGNLRKVAQNHAIEVHGILWACDLMEHHQTATATELYVALRAWHQDSLVRLPQGELQQRIKRLAVKTGKTVQRAT